MYGCREGGRARMRSLDGAPVQFGWRLSFGLAVSQLTLDTRGASDSLLRHNNACNVHGIALSASAARHVCRSYDADAAPLAGYIGTPSSAGAKTKTWCYRLSVAGTHRGRHYRDTPLETLAFAAHERRMQCLLCDGTSMLSPLIHRASRRIWFAADMCYHTCASRRASPGTWSYTSPPSV